MKHTTNLTLGFSSSPLSRLVLEIDSSWLFLLSLKDVYWHISPSSSRSKTRLKDRSRSPNRLDAFSIPHSQRKKVMSWSNVFRSTPNPSRVTKEEPLIEILINSFHGEKVVHKRMGSELKAETQGEKETKGRKWKKKKTHPGTYKTIYKHLNNLHQNRL